MYLTYLHDLIELLITHRCDWDVERSEAPRCSKLASLNNEYSQSHIDCVYYYCRLYFSIQPRAFSVWKPHADGASEQNKSINNVINYACILGPRRVLCAFGFYSENMIAVPIATAILETVFVESDINVVNRNGLVIQLKFNSDHRTTRSSPSRVHRPCDLVLSVDTNVLRPIDSLILVTVLALYETSL